LIDRSKRIDSIAEADIQTKHTRTGCSKWEVADGAIPMMTKKGPAIRVNIPMVKRTKKDTRSQSTQDAYHGDDDYDDTNGECLTGREGRYLSRPVEPKKERQGETSRETKTRSCTKDAADAANKGYIELD